MDILGRQFIANIGEEYQYLFEVDNMYAIKMFGAEALSGWKDLITAAIYKIAELDVDKSIRIVQIKEKFGGLRIYINGGDDIVDREIYKFENLSYTVCEECGSPGKLRMWGSWYETRCDTHTRENSRTVE